MSTTNLSDQDALRTDLLVVGSGAGALTAAITAADLGLEVLVIEKSHLWGGTSATSGGTLWIPCTRHMEAAGVPDDADDAMTYLRELVDDEVLDNKLQAYIDNASKMLEYLEDKCDIKFRCVQYADYHMDLPGAREHRSHEPLPIYAKQLGPDYNTLQPMHKAAQAFGRVNWTITEARPLLTRRPGWFWNLIKVMGRYYLDLPQRFRTPRDSRLTAGNALLGGLRIALNKRKIPLLLGVALEELITSQALVIGAVINQGGVRRKVYTKRGVLLAAGGFERNDQMRNDNFATASSSLWTGAQPYNTGDAIRAAQQAGAQLALMDSAWWAPVMRFADEDRARPMFAERALPGCMIVNQLGKRYMNESASYHVAGGEMMRLNSAECPTSPSWFVFDAGYRGRYVVGPLMPGPPSMDKHMKQSTRDVIKRGDTIAELAAEINVDASVLEATFQRFNEHAKQGEDPDFQRGVNGYDRYYGDPRNKPNPCLAPLVKAPFYAARIYPGDIGTKGGVLTDVNGQARHTGGLLVHGLYAVGNSSASMMGRTYPGAGTTLGPAMTFG
ncbi:MAG: FAD-binding protein, partial [Pseudomonadales bacterium]